MAKSEHVLGWEFARPASPFSDDGPANVRVPRSCALCNGRPTKGCKCQRKAVQALGLSDRFVKLIAPPGWGKSFYILYDIVRRAAANPDLKFVIVIPRLAIGRGFVSRQSFDMGDGTVGEFARLPSRNNLCDDLADERSGVPPSKIARIRRWLRAPATRSLSGRVLLVSHAAWACAIGPDFRLSGVHVYVDEAHHLSQNECDADGCQDTGDDGATEMGVLVKRALDAGCGGLTLTTATYFRLDRRRIIPAEHEGKFKTFFVPLNLHMRNNLRRLAKVSFRTVVLRDGQDELEVVRHLLASGRRAIVFLPRKNQALAGGSSRGYARDMARLLSEMGIKAECFVGDRTLQKKKLRRFLGLGSATEEERDAYLRGLGAILTINMFDEGADWPQAELAVDLAPPGGVGRSVQRIGRLLRDEKEACEYVSVYPPLATDERRTREAVSDRQNAALAMMVSIDAQIAGTGSPTRLLRRSYVDRVLPDAQDQHDFRSRAMELLAAVDSSDKREMENVRRFLLDELRGISGVGDEATLLRAAAELLRHAVLTVGRMGGGAGAGRAPRAIRTIGSAISLAELRRLFDIVVSEGAGVFATAAPLTHRELRELRNHISGLLESFTLAMVERCALAHRRKHGKSPSTVSGTECLPKGWRWNMIDARLRRSGGSLPRFLTEMGIAKEEFSEAMVERCARTHRRKHGKSPTTKSGTECLPKGWRWDAIDARLRRSGGSLPRFMTERGIAEVKEEFSEAMVERCARAHRRKHGKSPTTKSGTECLPKGWRWDAIDARLRKSGSSLSRFLVRKKSK